MRKETAAKRFAFELSAAVAASFCPHAACAQYAPPPPYVYAWNGLYLGLNAGVARGADAISEGGSSFGLGFGITTSGSGTMSATGFTGGVAAGYNWQSGGYVLGIETDVSYIGLNGTQDMAAVNFTSITEHDSFETSWLSTVRGRFGYGWGGWLLYLTGGAAIGDHKYDGVIRVFGIANPSGDVVKVGWAAGTGTEWMFAGGWSTKVEYLHVDLGSETFTANVFSNKVSVTGHLTENILRLGLNYKLGW